MLFKTGTAAPLDVVQRGTSEFYTLLEVAARAGQVEMCRYLLRETTWPDSPVVLSRALGGFTDLPFQQEIKNAMYRLFFEQDEFDADLDHYSRREWIIRCRGTECLEILSRNIILGFEAQTVATRFELSSRLQYANRNDFLRLSGLRLLDPRLVAQSNSNGTTALHRVARAIRELSSRKQHHEELDQWLELGKVLLRNGADPHKIANGRDIDWLLLSQESRETFVENSKSGSRLDGGFTPLLECIGSRNCYLWWNQRQDIELALLRLQTWAKMVVDSGCDLLKYGVMEKQMWKLLLTHYRTSCPGRGNTTEIDLKFGKTPAEWSLETCYSYRTDLYAIQKPPGSYPEEPRLPTMIPWAPSTSEKLEGPWSVIKPKSVSSSRVKDLRDLLNYETPLFTTLVEVEVTMSGLEALRVACNMIQVISAGIETISLCRAFYNGDPTTDGVLEDNARSMMTAADMVSKQCRTSKLQAPEDQELGKLAQRCYDASKELHDEVQSITRTKGQVSKAIYAALKLRFRKTRIEELEKRFNSYRNTMETHILVQLYEVKILIANMAAGFTKIEDLTKERNKAITETKKAEAALKSHLTNELQRSELTATARPSVERLIGSLKCPEMNKRLNDITPADETTFTRIFRSFNAVTTESEEDGRKKSCNTRSRHSASISSFASSSEEIPLDTSEIDVIWTGFVEWLRSSSSLFWIQGKPGSGKSTLIKFLVKHEATKALLGHWRNDPVIVCHFFWKVGTENQSSLKGFFGSLVHQLLISTSDDKITHFVLERFPGVAKKEYFQDWSQNELESLAFDILQIYTLPVCIFIDGCDEIAYKDGPSRLITTIHKLREASHIKLCVSGRPEWLFSQRFKNVPTLKLEKLTEPDMRALVHKSLGPSLIEDVFSAKFKIILVKRLVSKAEGVFLWLSLALRSIQSGLDNGDCEDQISARLEGLPSQLEDLYADMWHRLNQDNLVYRARAAYLMKLAMARTPNFMPRAFILMAATDVKVQSMLLDSEEEINEVYLADFCDKARREFSTRCVGLLEYTPLQPTSSATKGSGNLAFALSHDIGLTHRTVHDFLLDTEPGQRILSYDPFDVASLRWKMQLVRGALCTARLVKLIEDMDIWEFLWQLVWSFRELYNNSSVKTSDGIDKKEILSILDDIAHFYKKEIIKFETRPAWYPPCPFLVLVARISTPRDVLEEYVLTAVRTAGPSLATDILREIWFRPEYPNLVFPSLSIIKGLLALGADTNSSGLCFSEPTTTDPQFVPAGTATTRFLLYATERIVHEVDKLDSGPDILTLDWAPDLAEMIAMITKDCQSLEHHVICLVSIDEELLSTREIHQNVDYKFTIFVIEVDLKFLLNYILSRIKTMIATSRHTLDDLYARIQNTYSAVPYVIQDLDDHGYTVTRTPNQEAAAQFLIPRIFTETPIPLEERFPNSKELETLEHAVQNTDCLYGKGIEGLLELVENDRGFAPVTSLKAAATWL
ncbi:hypothetical protein HJFPF1_10982 [Paramyrothecium foliicola]|nr:hypothetical protein HJFPF1_10982 [Paramyrothecium foliicola]